MLSRGWVFLQALKYGREVVCFFLCLLMQLAAGTIWCGPPIVWYLLIRWLWNMQLFVSFDCCDAGQCFTLDGFKKSASAG